MDEDGLKVLLARGVSVEQIAGRFQKDPSTVSYWMAKYGLQAPSRDKHAARGGIARERLEELVADDRSIAEIAEAGGRCVVCGYDRSQAALAFHHVDPTQKRMIVSAQALGVGIARLREGARKCVLVCHNCLGELEAGVVLLPVE